MIDSEPPSCSLRLASLPHGTSEGDLREVFDKFGHGLQPPPHGVEILDKQVSSHQQSRDILANVYFKRQEDAERATHKYGQNDESMKLWNSNRKKMRRFKMKYLRAYSPSPIPASAGDPVESSIAPLVAVPEFIAGQVQLNDPVLPEVSSRDHVTAQAWPSTPLDSPRELALDTIELREGVGREDIQALLQDLQPFVNRLHYLRDQGRMPQSDIQELEAFARWLQNDVRRRFPLRGGLPLLLFEHLRELVEKAGLGHVWHRVVQAFQLRPARMLLVAPSAPRLSSHPCVHEEVMLLQQLVGRRCEVCHSLQGMRDRLQAGGIDFVHVIGDGREYQQILEVSDEGRVEPALFCRHFVGVRSQPAVVLNFCRSLPIARWLVDSKYASCAVGYEHDISDFDAMNFAKTLYRHWVTVRSLQAAIHIVKSEARSHSDLPEWYKSGPVAVTPFLHDAPVANSAWHEIQSLSKVLHTMGCLFLVVVVFAVVVKQQQLQQDVRNLQQQGHHVWQRELLEPWPQNHGLLIPATEIAKSSWCSRPFLRREQVPSKAKLHSIVQQLKSHAHIQENALCLAEAFMLQGYQNKAMDKFKAICSAASSEVSASPHAQSLIHVACARLYSLRANTTGVVQHIEAAVPLLCDSTELETYACLKLRLLLSEWLSRAPRDSRDVHFAESNASLVARVSSDFELTLEAFGLWGSAARTVSSPQAAVSVYEEAAAKGMMSFEALGRHHSASLPMTASVILRRYAEAAAETIPNVVNSQGKIVVLLQHASYFSSLSDDLITQSKQLLTEARIYVNAGIMLDRAEDLIEQGCNKLRSRIPRLEPSNPSNLRCFREMLFFANVSGRTVGSRECSALCRVLSIIKEVKSTSWDPDVEDIININTSLRAHGPAEWCSLCTVELLEQ